MSRYRIEGKKEYKYRIDKPTNHPEVLIGDEWIPMSDILALNTFEGNQLLDDQYKIMETGGHSREFIGKIEEFRQRYNRQQYTAVLYDEDDTD